jgi:hypothetical protein
VEGGNNEKARGEQSFDGEFHILREWWLRSLNKNDSQ